MEKILIVLVCSVLAVSGCSAQTRLTRLKNRGENVVIVEIKGNVNIAKQDIKEIAKALNLIYLDNTETNDYVEVRQNNVTAAFKSLLFGSMAAGYTKLGFFFSYNNETDKDMITISEEVSAFGNPQRNFFVDKLKLRDLERQKQAEKANHGI